MSDQHAVFVIEDEPHTRELLANAVTEHPMLTLVDAVGTLAEARTALPQMAECAVVLVDLGLPDGDGIDIIHALTQQSAQTQAQQPTAQGPHVLVISVFGDELHVVRAIEAGAVGYLLKDLDDAELGESIVRVVDGESPINPAIARHLLKRFQPPASTTVADQAKDNVSASADAPRITPREFEILKLMARGFTNQELAELLEVSTHTVTSHIKNLYRKMSVNSRSEAVFEAVQLGLVELQR